jgi:ubiquitin C-terminal hydrolase
MFLHAMKQLSTLDRRKQRETTLSKILTDIPGLSRQLCSELLSENDYDEKRTISALSRRVQSSKQNEVQLEHILSARRSWRGDTKSSGLSEEAFFCVWDTTRGLLNLEDEGPFAGLAVAGKSTITSNFSTADFMGVIRSVGTGKWALDGVRCDTTYPKYAYPSHCSFRFNGQNFEGKWEGKVYNLVKEAVPQVRAPAGCSGLVNLGNSCYQNSFFQTLFANDDLRKSFLSIDLSVNADDSKDVNDAKRISGELQKLFAQMQMTQQPSLSAQQLKYRLPAPFNGGQQHDCYQFAQMMINALSESLPDSTDSPNLVNKLLGGTVRNVITCEQCGHSRHHDESFTDLLVAFPKNFSPITDVCVVSGVDKNIPPPAGFDRIAVNTNGGREGALITYLCVKRDPDADPITNIDTVHSRLPLTSRPSWTLIDGNLNDGGLGDAAHMQLQVQRSALDAPITALCLTDATSGPPDGFEMGTTNLNLHSGGKDLRLCLKRGSPVRDVILIAAEDYKSALTRRPEGYVLDNQNINIFSKRAGSSRHELFLGYTLGGNKTPITNLAIVPADSTSEEKNMEFLDFVVGLVPMKLAVTRGHGCPLVRLKMCIAPNAPARYGDEEHVNMITTEADAADTAQADIDISSFDWKAEGTGDVISLAYSPESKDWVDCYSVSGTYETSNGSQGSMTGTLFPTSENNFTCIGQWRENGLEPSPLIWQMNPTTNTFAGNWHQNHSLGNWNGTRIAGRAEVQESEEKGPKVPPIVHLLVVGADVAAPPGYEILRRTPSGNDGNLNSGHGPELYLAVLRQSEEPGAAGSEFEPIEDVVMIWNDIEVPPDNYEIVQMILPENKEEKVPANPNHGTSGQAMLICFKRMIRGAEKQTLTSICAEAAKAKVPPNHQRLQETPASLEANLNHQNTGGEPMFLFTQYRSVPRQKSAEELAEEKLCRISLEGMWNTDEGILTLEVTSRMRGRRLVMTGGLRSDTKANFVCLLQDLKTRNYKLTGQLRAPCPPGYPQRTDASGRRMDRVLVGDMQGSFKDGTVLSYRFTMPKDTMMKKFVAETKTVKAHKNYYAVLAFTRDFRSKWQQGVELFSSSTGGNSLDHMTDDNFAPQVLDGANRLTCDICKTKTISIKTPVVHRAPEHLLVTIKRFAQNYTTGRLSKLLDTASFNSHLQLPVPSDPVTINAAFGDEAKLTKPVYGLYGIIVHKGMDLNGGHYFAYTRSGDSAAVDEKGSSKWHCFNDDQVSSITLKEIQTHLSGSVEQSCYMLMYKRLDLSRQVSPVSSPLPSLLDSVISDNKDFLEKSYGFASSFFLQYLHASELAAHNVTDQFSVPATADSSAPSGAPNIQRWQSLEDTRASSGACRTCLGDHDDCPYLRFSTTVCTGCAVVHPVGFQHQAVCPAVTPPALPVQQFL